MTIGIMEVVLMGAKGLKSTDFLGKIDPYVVMQYKNQVKTSRTARGQGSTSLWNQKFSFRVEYPTIIASSGEDKEKHKLFIQIMDRDTFTRDDHLGETIIYLKELFQLGLENGKAEIPTQKYRVVSRDKTYQGEIQLGITFTAKGKTDEQDCGGWKESQVYYSTS